MTRRIHLSFTDEEYAALELSAAKAKAPTNQYCKDIILGTNLEYVKAKDGSFTKNHLKLLAEMKSYASKHTGTFQLRDLKSWGKVTQGTFNDEEVFPYSIRPALGRAIVKDVENGRIPNVRILYTIKDGKRVPKMDKYGVIIYEIIPERTESDINPDYTIDEAMDQYDPNYENE